MGRFNWEFNAEFNDLSVRLFPADSRAFRSTINRSIFIEILGGKKMVFRSLLLQEGGCGLFEFLLSHSTSVITSSIEKFSNLFSLQRSKHFVLHERIDDDQSKLSGANLAQQLTIEGHLDLQPYSMRFPRVIKLTLKDTKLEEDSSFLTHLNSLVTLSQITDLIITENRMSIDQLRLFPNLQSLTLSNLPTRMRTYRNTKLIKLNIDDDVCELKHLRHLLRFFPHLQSLEIGMNEDQWKDILRLILTKSKDLFSLFLLNINSQFFEQISKFLQRENLIEDYTIERMEGGLYLWW